MHETDGSVLRGIFLTSFTAFILFSFLIFGIHIAIPNTMNVEPEVVRYEHYFYHPEQELVEINPAEDEDFSLLKWWMDFSVLGTLLSSCTCLFCIWLAGYDSRIS